MPSVCGVKVNRIGHCFKFKHNGRKRSILKLEERFGSVRTNEFIRIQNKSGVILPGTGGMGTIAFTVIGVLVIALGVAWTLKRKNA